MKHEVLRKGLRKNLTFHVNFIFLTFEFPCNVSCYINEWKMIFLNINCMTWMIENEKIHNQTYKSQTYAKKSINKKINKIIKEKCMAKNHAQHNERHVKMDKNDVMWFLRKVNKS